MSIYKRRISTRDKMFQNREIRIETNDSLDVIPIDNDVVICGGCNNNIYSEKEETFGWLIYFDKDNNPYDIYCDECIKHSFSDAIEVMMSK